MQIVEQISVAVAYPMSAAQQTRAAAVLAAHTHELRSALTFWKRLCAMLATLLCACAIVIVLQYLKLP